MIKETVHKLGTRVVNSKLRWRLPTQPRFPSFFNKECYYLDALYSTLVELNPRFCLEIGTHDGKNSTRVFQKYFSEVRPDGRLITLDIKKIDDLGYSNVSQVIVYPHHENIYKTCGASGRWFNEKDLKQNYKNKIKSSVSNNVEIIKNEMEKHKIKSFDLSFIDGDHEKSSFMMDIETCLELSPESWILIDDTKEEFHPCCHVYHDDIKKSGKFETYDFENWDRFVGMSMIRSKK
jgi:hypothetical protein